MAVTKRRKTHRPLSPKVKPPRARMPETVASVAGAPGHALVLGVNGQDGSYLAEQLLQSGWQVTGVGRQAGSRWVDASHPGFRYHGMDLTDDRALSALLLATGPTAVFHFAAVHGSAGFDYESRWRDVHAVNTLATHAVLEHLRCHAPDAVLVYASSSKVFRTAAGGVFNESSPRESTCIYSTTKNAATDLIAYYRNQHHAKVSVVWTFNHESPRRGESYFLPRIVNHLASALGDPGYVGEIASLSFWSDWSDARDFMAATAAIAQQAPGEDFVLASGRTLWAEDFVADLFERYGLQYQRHLAVKFPPEGGCPPAFSADTAKLRQRVTCPPMRPALEVAEDMLRRNHPTAWERILA
jgi:GDPmannose 4,6-dehydratase